MEKVSVATRFPFMKPPKDPESPICPAGSLPAPTAAPAITSSQNVPTMNIVLNVTSPLLQFLYLPQFPGGPLPRLRLRRRSCRQSQPAVCQPSNAVGGLHTTAETVSGPAAADVRLSPAGTAETTHPQEHPERLLAIASAPAAQHFQPAQKLHPLNPQPEARILALRLARAVHLPRHAGIQLLPTRGKSVQCFVLRGLESDRPGLRSPNPSVGSRLARHYFCRRP